MEGSIILTPISETGMSVGGKGVEDDTYDDIRLALKAIVNQLSFEERLHDQANDIVLSALEGCRVSSELSQETDLSMLGQLIENTENCPTIESQATTIVRDALTELLYRSEYNKKRKSLEEGLLKPAKSAVMRAKSSDLLIAKRRVSFSSAS